MDKYLKHSDRVTGSLEKCRQREADRSPEFALKRFYEKSQGPDAVVQGVNVPTRRQRVPS